MNGIRIMAFIKKNLINVQSLIKEEMRDEYDKDLVFYRIKQLKNGINDNNNLNC